MSFEHEKIDLYRLLHAPNAIKIGYYFKKSTEHMRNSIVFAAKCFEGCKYLLAHKCWNFKFII